VDPLSEQPLEAKQVTGQAQEVLVGDGSVFIHKAMIFPKKLGKLLLGEILQIVD
jgi:hypothetical protein